MDINAAVSFVCQRCLQPLILDNSFNSFSEHKLAELSLPVFSAPEIDLNSQCADLDHYVPAFRISNSNSGSNEFTLLGEESSNLGHQMKLAADLFDIISGHTEINHPLCEECTDTLLDILDHDMKMIEDDCQLYKDYLAKLHKEEEPDLQALNKELEKLENEENKLLEELKTVRLEEERIQMEIEEAEKSKKAIGEEEENFWREYNKYNHKLGNLEDEYRSLEYALNYSKVHLAKLQKTNVFDTTFCIWHKGHFGTINNFRLGRLPTAPVEWSEINAAWGQTTLLLDALRRKSNLTFQKYRLVPYGSHSYIEVLDEDRELPLYGSGGFRFLWDTKFDAAMVAFLDCLQQFKEEVEKGKYVFNLPYRMEKGKITDSGTGKSYSITIQFNSEEQWTKALRLMLTNLKWMLAWVSIQFCNE